MKKIAALLFSVLLIATAGSACSGSAGHRGTVKTTVSAESFGADGTDTSDDTKALQDALFYARDNATSDVPVTVTLGDGTYYLRQAVTIYSHTRLTLSDNAVLVFTGQEGLMLFGGADRNSYDAVTDVMISGGVWRGNASRTGAHTEPIGFHSASGITAGDPKKGGYPYSSRCPQQKDAFADQWGMYICECVSYTAWKVYSTYGYMPYWGGRGNAKQWPANARAAGYTVSNIPKVHSVGISTGGAYGHAVWVEAVSGNRVYISQYNYRNAATGYRAGEYSEQWVDKGMYQYIYFGN